MSISIGAVICTSVSLYLIYSYSTTWACGVSLVACLMLCSLTVSALCESGLQDLIIFKAKLWGDEIDDMA